MYLKIMISISLVALAVALFMTSNANYRVFLQFLICASTALIVWERCSRRGTIFFGRYILRNCDRFQPDRSICAPRPRVLLP